MSEFFEEYGWTCLAAICGFLGISIFTQLFFTDGCTYWGIITTFLEQLM